MRTWEKGSFLLNHGVFTIVFIRRRKQKRVSLNDMRKWEKGSFLLNHGVFTIMFIRRRKQKRVCLNDMRTWEKGREGKHGENGQDAERKGERERGRMLSQRKTKLLQRANKKKLLMLTRLDSTPSTISYLSEPLLVQI